MRRGDRDRCHIQSLLIQGGFRDSNELLVSISNGFKNSTFQNLNGILRTLIQTKRLEANTWLFQTNMSEKNSLKCSFMPKTTEHFFEESNETKTLLSPNKDRWSKETFALLRIDLRRKTSVDKITVTTTELINHPSDVAIWRVLTRAFCEAAWR